MSETSQPTHLLFGPRYAVTTLGRAAEQIIEHACHGKSFGVTALATHGLIETIKDPDLGRRINEIDMILPDGQAVAWSLRSFHGPSATQRIAGMDITEAVLQRASDAGLKLYLFGSTRSTLEDLVRVIEHRYPGVRICGTHEDRFRDATVEEDAADIAKIAASGAQLVFVGRGCPRQEKWVIEHRDRIQAPLLAIGAVFDFMTGNIERAPRWMQRSGIEWVHRLMQEPRRLAKRYVQTNSRFIYLVLSHKLTGRAPSLD